MTSSEFKNQKLEYSNGCKASLFFGGLGAAGLPMGAAMLAWGLYNGNTTAVITGATTTVTGAAAAATSVGLYAFGCVKRYKELDEIKVSFVP